LTRSDLLDTLRAEGFVYVLPVLNLGRSSVVPARSPLATNDTEAKRKHESRRVSVRAGNVPERSDVKVSDVWEDFERTYQGLNTR
jgi:hypothetical protein